MIETKKLKALLVWNALLLRWTVAFTLALLGSLGFAAIIMGGSAGASPPEVFAFFLSGTLPWFFPTLGLAGGFGLMRVFNRGQEDFWWNLGIGLPWRLVTALLVHTALGAAGGAGLSWLS